MPTGTNKLSSRWTYMGMKLYTETSPHDMWHCVLEWSLVCLASSESGSLWIGTGQLRVIMMKAWTSIKWSCTYQMMDGQASRVGVRAWGSVFELVMRHDRDWMWSQLLGNILRKVGDLFLFQVTRTFIGYFSWLCKGAWECVWYRNEDPCYCRMGDSWAKLIEDEWRNDRPDWNCEELVLGKLLVEGLYVWWRKRSLVGPLDLAKWKIRQ